MKKTTSIIEKFGWKKYSQNFFQPTLLNQEEIARVKIENKSNYTLQSNAGELEGFLRGNSLYKNEKSSALPKVGDWVKIEKLPNEKRAIIKEVFPRKSKLARKEKMDSTNEQILVTNIDTVFIVQGLDDDFSLRRLERYQSIAKEGGNDSVIILNKIDLVNDYEKYFNQVKETFPETKILTLSAKNSFGIDKLQESISPFETVVFVGSSGAGKSTIINKLLLGEVQATQSVRKDDSKGRHTTTRRELFILKNGGIVIDTPGMREVGINTTKSLDISFSDIKALIKNCKFTKCDHNKTEGCAVKKAIKDGDLDQERYKNFLKLESEIERNEMKKSFSYNKERKHKKKTISKAIRKLKKHTDGYFDF